MMLRTFSVTSSMCPFIFFIHVIESLTSRPDMAIVTGNEPQRDQGEETEL